MNASEEMTESLGLPCDTFTNKTSFIHAVRSGIPGSVVKRAIQELNNRELIVRILDTSTANLSRVYRKQHMTSHSSEEMLDTIRLYRQTIHTFENKEKALEWIKTPLPALAGDSPENLFDTFEGRQWVAQVLRKIEYGEFT